MTNELAKAFLIDQHQEKVALTLPLTWDKVDLPKEAIELAKDSLPEWIEVCTKREPHPEEIQNWKAALEKDSQYHSKQILAQLKALRFCQEKGWWTESSYLPRGGRFVVLEAFDDALIEQVKDALAFYGLHANFSPPEAMWDQLLAERVSTEFAMALYGDDRAQRDGNYYICVSYSFEEADKLWFPDIPFCGAF